MATATAAHEPQRLIITPAQYEAIAGSPLVIPTQREIFESQLALYTEYELGTESEFARLAEFIPETGLFLLVPKKPDPIDLGKLMSMVEHDGKRGTSYLDPQYLTDQVVTPEGHYLVLGVEDGRGRLNVKPSVSEKAIVAEKRSPYVAFEGIVHAAVFPVLSHHNLDCVGSRCHAKDVPRVYLRGDGPALGTAAGPSMPIRSGVRPRAGSARGLGPRTLGPPVPWSWAREKSGASFSREGT